MNTKSIWKIGYYALGLVLALQISSCSEEEHNFTPTPEPNQREQNLQALQDVIQPH